MYEKCVFYFLFFSLFFFLALIKVCLFTPFNQQFYLLVNSLLPLLLLFINFIPTTKQKKTQQKYNKSTNKQQQKRVFLNSPQNINWMTRLIS